MDEYVVVTTAAGTMQAEILRGLLESRDIPVVLRRESAGAAVGLGIGPLGEVDVCVPEDSEDAARQVLDDYYAGRLED
jgi:hypothetical protein